VMIALQFHLKRISNAFTMSSLFHKIPAIRFIPNEKRCCDCSLTVLKTNKRELATLLYGKFQAQETVYQCEKCKLKYSSSELKHLIPYRCYFGFDIITYIGTALYVEKRRVEEIQSVLGQNGIAVSLREIAFLGKKYMTYLTIAHNESREKISNYLQAQGGYILHLDGTCEGNTPHLFSSMDGLSGIILHNVKMPTENKKYIIPFLEEIKASFGDPIAIISDMSQSIIKAASHVFPEVNHLICHFHFLRDIGKDLFRLEYNNINRFLKAFNIKDKLRKSIRELKSLIDNTPSLHRCLEDYLARKNLEEPCHDLPEIIAAYILLSWVIEAQVESKGYGFPFDRPHVDFIKRLHGSYQQLKELNVLLKKSESIALPIRSIYNVLNDPALEHNWHSIKGKIIVFDQLRSAMRIAQVDGKDGLRSEGDYDVKKIELAVKAFRNSSELKQLSSENFFYKKFVKQIDKYWSKLFADPIKVKTSSGETKLIFPQRTNNNMEHSFRGFKKDERQRTGTKSLRKQMHCVHPQRPLIKNLTNPEYLNIILNGKENLAERFADIDAKLVQDEMKKEREVARKYHKGMSKVFKILDLPKKLFPKLTDNKLAA